MMTEFIQKQDKRNENQNRINAQTSQELVDIRTTLSQLAVSLSQEKGKFPAQPQKNPRGVNEVSKCKGRLQCRYHTRNGKESEGPKDEPTVEKNVRNEKASEKYEEVIVSKNKMSVSNHMHPMTQRHGPVWPTLPRRHEALNLVQVN
ncbi:hypothetical protein AAG906_006554 [Vitis piasezkii]